MTSSVPKFAWILVSGVLAVQSALAADSDFQSEVKSAAAALAASPGYRWNASIRTEGAGPFSGTSGVTGQTQKDGYTWVTSTTPGGTLEFARKGEQTAVVLDGSWMTLQQATARSAGRGTPSPFNQGGFDRQALAQFKMPPEQVDDVLGKVSNLHREGNAITAELTPEVVNDLILAGTPLGGRGGRNRGRGGAAPQMRNAQGTVSFTISDGVLTGFSVALNGLREAAGNEEKLSRVTTTTISKLGASGVELPANAKEIVDALVAGRTPDVFVPDPGFNSLFNGHDLTGWAGRPEHWSVQDGAITGKTTRENPAKGNNFLIAKSGDKNLIVDDFELRFLYRIIPDNDAGFANSGDAVSEQGPGQLRRGRLPGRLRSGPELLGHSLRRGGRRRRPRHHGRTRRVGDLDRRWQKGSHRPLGQIRGDPGQDQAERLERVRVIAQGNRLQHFINGVPTVGVVDQTEGKRLRSGILALQLHAGEPMTVQAKNIEIKSLSTAGRGRRREHQSRQGFQARPALHRAQGDARARGSRCASIRKAA